MVELTETPLRALVMIAQTQAGMWRRNGYSLLNQVCGLCDSIFKYVNVQLYCLIKLWDGALVCKQLVKARFEHRTLLPLGTWLSSFSAICGCLWGYPYSALRQKFLPYIAYFKGALPYSIFEMLILLYCLKKIAYVSILLISVSELKQIFEWKHIFKINSTENCRIDGNMKIIAFRPKCYHIAYWIFPQHYYYHTVWCDW